MKRLMVALAPLSAAAFVSQSQSSPLRHLVSAVDDDWEDTAGSPSVDLDLPPPPPRRKQVVYSPSIPFLECPPVLVDCTMAGNVGFDPLGFAKDKETLETMREAEIRHARLAMLVGAEL